MRGVLVAVLLMAGACQHDRALATDAAVPPNPHAQTISFFCHSIDLARSAFGYQMAAAKPRRVEDCVELVSRMRQADALLMGYQLGSSAALAAGDFPLDKLPTVQIEEAVGPTLATCKAARFDEVLTTLTALTAKGDAALDGLLAVCTAKGWRPYGRADGGTAANPSSSLDLATKPD